MAPFLLPERSWLSSERPLESGTVRRRLRSSSRSWGEAVVIVIADADAVAVAAAVPVSTAAGSALSAVVFVAPAVCSKFLVCIDDRLWRKFQLQTPGRNLSDAAHRNRDFAVRACVICGISHGKQDRLCTARNSSAGSATQNLWEMLLWGIRKIQDFVGGAPLARSLGRGRIDPIRM